MLYGRLTQNFCSFSAHSKLRNYCYNAENGHKDKSKFEDY